VYCDKAKSLLTRLGYEYEEKIVTKDLSLQELFEALGKPVRTIPQIVIDDKHIGGYNELKEYFVDQGKINFEGEQIG
jgi:glutaredoxin